MGVLGAANITKNIPVQDEEGEAKQRRKACLSNIESSPSWKEEAMRRVCDTIIIITLDVGLAYVCFEMSHHTTRNQVNMCPDCCDS